MPLLPRLLIRQNVYFWLMERARTIKVCLFLLYRMQTRGGTHVLRLHELRPLNAYIQSKYIPYRSPILHFTGCATAPTVTYVALALGIAIDAKRMFMFYKIYQGSKTKIS